MFNIFLSSALELKNKVFEWNKLKFNKSVLFVSKSERFLTDKIPYLI